MNGKNGQDRTIPPACRERGIRAAAAHAPFREPPASRRPPSLRGFTLVELLVVIAIIAILLALLMPSLKGIKQRAVQLTCLQQLRNCGQAMTLYLADNQKFPDKILGAQASWLGKAGRAGGYGVEGLQADDRPLNKYLGGPYSATNEVPIARCPGDRQTIYTRGYPTWYDAEGTSYVPNTPTSDAATSGGGTHEGLAGDGLVNTGNVGRKLGEVAYPTRMIAIAEVGAFADCWWSSAQWTADRQHFLWHNQWDKFNIVFADGHGGFIQLQPQTISGKDYTFHREMQ